MGGIELWEALGDSVPCAGTSPGHWKRGQKAVVAGLGQGGRDAGWPEGGRVVDKGLGARGRQVGLISGEMGACGVQGPGWGQGDQGGGGPSVQEGGASQGRR